MAQEILAILFAVETMRNRHRTHRARESDGVVLTISGAGGRRGDGKCNASGAAAGTRL